MHTFKINSPVSGWRTAIVAAALPLLATPALAVATASVSFTSLSFSTSAGTLTWSAGDAFQALYAEVLEAGGIGGIDDDSRNLGSWAPGSIGAATTSASAGVTLAANQTFAVTASATPNYLSAFAFPHSASANGSVGGNFSLSAPGSVTAVVGYTVAVSAPGGNAVNNFASALAQLDLGNVTGSNSVMLEQQSFASATGMSSASGTFSLTVALGAGEVGFFNLLGSTTVNAPASVVPEPSHAVLLLAGLAGLAAQRGRQRRRAEC